MVLFDIPKELIEFVVSYDKVSYSIWEEEGNAQINLFRKKVRDHYLDEQKLTCFYCRSFIFSRNGLHWQVEHILPKSLFPQFLLEPKNLIVICPDCNREKSNQNPHINGEKGLKQKKYPGVSGRFKIIHPFYDLYQDHIDVVPFQHCEYPNHYFLKALTPKGKATVRMCDLNRFIQDFAGYKDLRGKQVKDFDEFMDCTGISDFSKDEKRELINKIMLSM